MTRRRRLTIAALVLLVFGGGLWWTVHPRIDSRLLGTWASDNPNASGMTRRFDRDGFALFNNARLDGSNRIRSVMRWEVDGSLLVMHFSYGNRLTAPFLKVFYESINRAFKLGSTVALRYRILEITPTTLQLQPFDAASGEVRSIQSFHRVAE